MPERAIDAVSRRGKTAAVVKGRAAKSHCETGVGCPPASKWRGPNGGKSTSCTSSLCGIREHMNMSRLVVLILKSCTSTHSIDISGSFSFPKEPHSNFHPVCSLPVELSHVLNVGRGLASTISALLCSSAVGSWIDRSPSRLRTLLTTICVNHTAMVAAYLCWLAWPASHDAGDQAPGTPFSDLRKGLLFGSILFLDVVHDLSAIGYRLCLERDWVPVLVGPIVLEMHHGLTQVNSVMMRIELICKLIAPSLLPLIVKCFEFQSSWVLFLVIFTILFWASGVWCVQIIARGNVQLQLPKQIFTSLNAARSFSVNDTFTFPRLPTRSWPRRIYGFVYRDPMLRLKHYFSFQIWPASMAIALLQLTVLAYSATLITYLLEIGFSLSAITIARASGAILGLSGTIITPMAVNYMKKRHTKKLSSHRPRNKEDSNSIEMAVTRSVGFLGVASQFLCLVNHSFLFTRKEADLIKIPVVVLLWNAASRATSSNESPTSPHVLITITLFAFLSLSRIGHFANYLMVQELGQVEIPASQRSTFAGVEQSFKSLCELSHWLATVVWSQPADFRWLALVSLLVTGLSAGTFGAWIGIGKKITTGAGIEYEGIPLAEFNDDDEDHDFIAQSNRPT